jgi:spore coat polysaccharide biosynthesis protein SpsF (cytidylyltransferase family)
MHQHDTATHPEGLTNRYPDGIGCEVFSRSRLQWMHETIIDPMHREHPHMIFHVRGCVASPRCPLEFARPDVRLDVNTPKDLALLNRLYAHIGGDPLSVHITKLIQAWDELEVQRDRATANRCEHDPI